MINYVKLSFYMNILKLSFYDTVDITQIQRARHGESFNQTLSTCSERNSTQEAPANVTVVDEQLELLVIFSHLCSSASHEKQAATQPHIHLHNRGPCGSLGSGDGATLL